MPPDDDTIARLDTLPADCHAVSALLSVYFAAAAAFAIRLLRYCLLSLQARSDMPAIRRR